MVERPWYDVLEVVGTGTYGVVCVAREVGAPDDEVVALKVLKADHLDDERVMSRSRDEAVLLGLLRHPNIVAVHDLLSIEGRPVVSMEYIAGISLWDLAQESEGKLPTDVCIEIVRRTAVGLDAAYNKPSGPERRPLRVVHRDLKPSNILISVHGEVKLVDFGIAKAFFEGREANTMSVVLGTRGYMSPERLDGGPDSPAGDVYALGLTLLELLLGEAVSLSLHPERHGDRLEEALHRFLPTDVPAPVIDLTREVLRGMLRYDLGERLRPGEVAHLLGSLLAHAGIHPDLVTFSRRRVLPRHDGREKVDPTEHAAWREISFLTPPERLRVALNRGAGDPDTAVRAFLEQPDWERRLPALNQLLASDSAWTEAPFLELVEQATPARWRFWSRPPPSGQVVAALRILKQRRTPTVKARVRELLKHPDPRVASAARHLLVS